MEKRGARQAICTMGGVCNFDGPPGALGPAPGLRCDSKETGRSILIWGRVSGATSTRCPPEGDRQVKNTSGDITES